MPAFSATRPTSLAEPDQRAGLLGAERGLDRAHGLARPQHRARGDRVLQHRRIDDLARGAAGPCGEPFAEPTHLARILHQRQSGAHRRGAADRNIGRGRHRETRGRKAEHQAIGLLAHGEMLALAHDVPDVADHEEIAGHGAGQARNIVGVAGDETGGKAFGEMRGGIFFLDRVADTAREDRQAARMLLVARQLDKTVGEIGIAALRARPRYCRRLGRGYSAAAASSLSSDERGGIVLRGQNRAGLAGMRPHARARSACSPPYRSSAKLIRAISSGKPGRSNRCADGSSLSQFARHRHSMPKLRHNVPDERRASLRPTRLCRICMSK